MNDSYETLVSVIVRHQEQIIGPIAWTEAKKVKGLKIDGREIKIEEDAKKVLKTLVEQYETIFGRASVEVCRDAVRSKLPNFPKNSLPDILM